MFVDTNDFSYESITFKPKNFSFLITDSNVPPNVSKQDIKLLKDDLNDCLRFLNARKPGTVLRDYSKTDLWESVGTIPERIRRRCFHFIDENERVIEARRALVTKKYENIGKLLNRSHESLRDLLEVSCPELDWLVKRSQETSGILGSRLTGSGFGGCTISLIKESVIDDYIKRLDEYERIFGFKPETFICTPTNGVSVLFNGKN